MKKSTALASIFIGLSVGVLVAHEFAHAETDCSALRYESLTLDLVEVTVDGVTQSSVEEYEGREFLLHREVDRGLRFLTVHDQQVDILGLSESTGDQP
jgi:hypothetical protein